MTGANLLALLFLKQKRKVLFYQTSIKVKNMCDLYNNANKDANIVVYNFQPLKSMDFHSYPLVCRIRGFLEHIL